MVHGPRAKGPSPGGSENLLLGLRDPSSVMDGWQLDVDGSRLPWWAYPAETTEAFCDAHVRALMQSSIWYYAV